MTKLVDNRIQPAMPLARSEWLAARARNATHRPVLIGAVSGAVFVLTLVALVLAPLRHGRTAMPAGIPRVRFDTAAAATSEKQSRARIAAAESALAVIRGRTKAVQAEAAAATPLDPWLSAKRENLESQLADLQAQLTRVQTSPLPSSYRELAATPALLDDRQIAALRDSLSRLERTRDTLASTATGTDPVFVALTARLTDIGRSIETIAENRRDSVRHQLEAIGSPTRSTHETPASELDTVPWVAERDSALSALLGTTAELARDRDSLASNVREIENARQDAASPASPIAMLGSAVVLGLLLGFVVALSLELKRPRVSGASELERLTGVRVTSTIRPTAAVAERSRRTADRTALPLIDLRSDAYQMAYLRAAALESNPLVLAISGDEGTILGVVAANLAALAVQEARATLIIDTDSTVAPVAATLRIRAEPGFADIARDHIAWRDVLTHATVGRDRMVDVVPSGIGIGMPGPGAVAGFLIQNMDDFARHYDAIIIVVGEPRVMRVSNDTIATDAVFPAANTLICARIGHTPLDTILGRIDAIRLAGGSPLGIVLWDAPAPPLPTRERLAAMRRPLHTAEMQAVTARR